MISSRQRLVPVTSPTIALKDARSQWPQDVLYRSNIVITGFSPYRYVMPMRVLYAALDRRLGLSLHHSETDLHVEEMLSLFHSLL
jgi:hypothetical protein